jgi:hypothetical protein
MKVAALKKTQTVVEAPTPADDRAALAQAIAAAAEAEGRVAHQRRAIERAVASIDETEVALAAAAAHIAEARELDTRRAAAAIAADRDVKTASRTAAAIEAEQELAAKLRLQGSARIQLEAELVQLEDDASDAQNQILIAIRRLISPVAMLLYQQLRADRVRVAVASRVLAELLADDDRRAPKFKNSLRSIRASEKRGAVLAKLRDNFQHLLLGQDNDANAGAEQELAKWRKALSALQTDADTELPPLLDALARR